MLENKKIFILGMARSGYEAAKLVAKNNTVLITDIKEQNEEQVKELKDLGVKYIIDDNPTDLLDNSFDLVIKNPGIKYTHPTVVKAHALNIPVINEVELAYSYMNKDVNIIGVTGSNGKTTTVTLIYNMLKEEFNNVFLGGNIGTPLSHYVRNIKAGDYLVLEISDHQLCDMYNFKTNVSVLTNIYDAHTDFHDSHERYVAMKRKIFNNQTNKDFAIINYDNEEAVNNSKDIHSKKLYFSTKHEEKAYIKNGAIYYENEKIIDCDEIKIKGIHNYENIMAAIIAVKIYNVNSEAIRKVLREFKGVEHRIEYVATIDGTSYYNDSKSTNCEATKIALKSFEQPTLLIMGGLERNHSFESLTSDMKNVTYVACYGQTKARIKEYCDKIGVDCGVFDTLKQATDSCYEKAERGNIVLLSPACASWDQYEKFEDRGNEFKEIVKKLEGDKNGI